MNSVQRCLMFFCLITISYYYWLVTKSCLRINGFIRGDQINGGWWCWVEMIWSEEVWALNFWRLLLAWTVRMFVGRPHGDWVDRDAATTTGVLCLCVWGHGSHTPPSSLCVGPLWCSAAVKRSDFRMCHISRCDSPRHVWGLWAAADLMRIFEMLWLGLRLCERCL